MRPTNERRRCNVTSLIASFMWPTWGPPGADRTHVGLMLAPWSLLSGAVSHWLDVFTKWSLKCCFKGWLCVEKTASNYLNQLYLYYNCEKYPLSPLKPRGLVLLSWHVPYNWGSGNSVHPSFTWFLSLNWRKSTLFGTWLHHFAYHGTLGGD